jgi:ankyrin repeat protein
VQDREGRTPLHEAAWRGHVDIARLLVDKGANINATDVKGQTPLYYAEKRWHTEIVEWLQSLGAEE